MPRKEAHCSLGTTRDPPLFRLSVWDRLQYVAAEVGLDNYVVAGKPFTWSAFTFEQMIPQKVSWVIMRQNANAIIQGAQRSRNGNGVQCATS